MPKMGRFFVVLVLAVALQVATAVGSDRGDDGHTGNGDDGHAGHGDDGHAGHGDDGHAGHGDDGHAGHGDDGHTGHGGDGHVGHGDDGHTGGREGGAVVASSDSDGSSRTVAAERDDEVRRRGREALEAMQEQRLRDEEALRSRYRLQQQLAREAEIDKRVQERLAARDTEARGLEKGSPLLIQVLQKLLVVIQQQQRQHDAFQEFLELYDRHRRSDASAARASSSADQAQWRTAVQQLTGLVQESLRQAVAPGTPRPNPGTPGGLPAGERKTRRVRCKVCSACKQLLAADTPRPPCETWGPPRGPLARDSSGRFLPSSSPAPLRDTLREGAPPEESAEAPVEPDEEELSLSTENKRKKAKKKEKRDKKRRMAECSDRKSMPDDDKRDGGDGGDGHGGSVPLLAAF